MLLDFRPLRALRRSGWNWQRCARPVGRPRKKFPQPSQRPRWLGQRLQPQRPLHQVDEDELHKKARRFAKLLVEEIKLYNQPRVEEGRQHKDLYDRLKVDIEKSRSTYDKRYAESAVASADYFTQELIRILADNDVSLMGAGFPRS